MKDSHFAVTPITNATGTLRFITVIFAAKEVSPEWSLEFDIFAEWDPEDSINIGPGKRHPGLSLLSADGKEIPMLFAASPKASMTSTILKETFKKMDELGITQHGVDEFGKLTAQPLLSTDTSPAWGKTSCGMSTRQQLIGK